MEIIDYNGDGRWSLEAILRRYGEYAREIGISPRSLHPLETKERGRKWIYPVMHEVIEGIKADDPACVRIGIEFIEEDAKFPFGRILKSNTARALRQRATLTDDQKARIRARVLVMLRDGHVPHEYKEYAKLLRRIGVSAEVLGELERQLNLKNPYVARFHNYFLIATRR